MTLAKGRFAVCKVSKKSNLDQRLLFQHFIKLFLDAIKISRKLRNWTILFWCLYYLHKSVKTLLLFSSKTITQMFITFTAISV